MSDPIGNGRIGGVVPSTIKAPPMAPPPPDAPAPEVPFEALKTLRPEDVSLAPGSSAIMGKAMGPLKSQDLPAPAVDGEVAELMRQLDPTAITASASASISGAVAAAPAGPGLPANPAAAMGRVLQGRPDLTDGADAVNFVELQTWVANYGYAQAEGSQDAMREAFMTGKEPHLLDGIVQAAGGPPPRQLKFEEVLAIALEANGGDMTKALLTIHNAFRQLSRGQEGGTMQQWIGPSGKNWQMQDPSFFKKYLDPSSIGITDGGDADMSDDWYHAMALATVSYVAEAKGRTGIVADMATARADRSDGYGIAGTVAGLAFDSPANDAARLALEARTQVRLALAATPEDRQRILADHARQVGELFPNAMGSADAVGEQAAKIRAGEFDPKEYASERRGVAIGTTLHELTRRR